MGRIPSIVGRDLLMADAPDSAVPVFGDEERTVLCDRDADGLAADPLIGNDEPGHEVLVFAGLLAGVVEQQAQDLVAGPFRTI